MSYSSVQTNVAANAAIYNINRASNNAANSVARLSSTNRNVRASDDVAAMSVGATLASQIAGMRSALTNATQGSSMMQVANGGMNQIIDILDRQKAIAVSAQNGALSAADRGYLDTEFQALTAQLDQIAQSTNFGGTNLLAGGSNTSIRLANTNANAAAFNPAGANGNTATSIASTTAIQAFDVTTGASLAGIAAVGQLNITDSLGAILVGPQFDAASTALRGKFSSFKISDVTYGVSAKLTATINGVEFSGTFANNATSAILGNGNSYVRVGSAAMALTNAATVSAAEGALSGGFANTSIMRTSVVNGVDFSGTRMAGVTGVATTGVSMIRTAGEANMASIGNFRYLGSSGADTNVLAVDVNGRTFTANTVLDLVDAAAATVYTFEAGDGEAITIDITGMTTPITNIRTNASDRAGFLDALNVGFSRAGGGLQFNVGNPNNQIAGRLGSATSASLYNAQSLEVGTAGTATTAETVLTSAIQNALSLQANIGAIQQNLEFSAAQLESSITGANEGRANYQDTDVAQESTNYALAQVQVQAGVSVLAQANLMPRSLLDLLNG